MASLVVSVMSRCAPYSPRPDAAWERTCGVGRVSGRKQYLRLHLGTRDGLRSQDKPQPSSKVVQRGRFLQARNGTLLGGIIRGGSIVEVLRMLRADLRELAQRARQMS